MFGWFSGIGSGAGGWTRPASIPAGLRAAIVGLVVGSAVEACLAYAAVSLFFKRYDPLEGSLVLPLLTHGESGCRGCHRRPRAGLGLGGQGRWRLTLIGGLLGAAVATIIYEIGGALAFDSSRTEMPLSWSVTTRAIALLLVAIFTAAGERGPRTLPCG